MNRFDAIVIGAGINGLTAAAVLAGRGKAVCVVEQSEHLGGMAAAPCGSPRMAHLLYNLSPLIRSETGLNGTRWPFRSHAIPTVVLSDTDPPVVVTGTQATLADGTPHPDARAFRELSTRLLAYGSLLRKLAEGPPPGDGAAWNSAAGLRRIRQLGGFGIALRQKGKSEMRRFLQVLLSNAYDLVLDDIPDGPLAGLLTADAVRGLAAGPRSPGTVFSLLYRYGHGGQVSVPVGGMPAVIGSFADRVKASGGVVHTATHVSRILTEKDRVTGVETLGGDVLLAPTVLSSAGPLAIAHATGPEHFDIEAIRRFRKIRARGTVAKINLTLKSLPDIKGVSSEHLGARFVVAPSADYVEAAFNPAKYGQMSPAPVLECVLPGVIDPAQEKGNLPAMSIIAQFMPSDLNGGWTEPAREQLKATVLMCLEPFIPDISALVADAEVLTPADIERETGAPGGHWHHAELGLDQILSVRPANGIGHYRLGPKGLFMCGASTHPGGDLMGLAGRNAALAALEAVR